MTESALIEVEAESAEAAIEAAHDVTDVDFDVEGTRYRVIRGAVFYQYRGPIVRAATKHGKPSYAWRPGYSETAPGIGQQRP